MLRISRTARFLGVNLLAFRDPRVYQITALASLGLYGVVALDFQIGAAQAGVTLAGVLAAQWLCTALLPGAGRFALVVLLACADGCAWVSPGQWGSVAFFAFALVCLGGLVVTRTGRADVALAFLVFYLGLVFGRSAYLGEPVTIPVHRLQSGALLLFAFFMISDPRTTPDSRAGRLVFAALVAFGGWYVQFRLFRTNGLLWSLAACSLLVPVLDRFLPGARFRWVRPPTANHPPDENYLPYLPGLPPGTEH